MGWLSDALKKVGGKVFDDVLGIDSTRGGVGGAIADAVDDINEAYSDAEDTVKGVLSDAEDYTREYLKDAEDFIVDDVGIDPYTLGTGLLMFTGVGGLIGSAIGSGLGSIGLSSGLANTIGGFVGTGLRTGAQLGVGTEALNQLRTGDFDLDRLGEAGFKTAGNYVLTSAVGTGLNVGLQAGLDKLSNFESLNFLDPSLAEGYDPSLVNFRDRIGGATVGLSTGAATQLTNYGSVSELDGIGLGISALTGASLAGAGMSDISYSNPFGTPGTEFSPLPGTGIMGDTFGSFASLATVGSSALVPQMMSGDAESPSMVGSFDFSTNNQPIDIGTGGGGRGDRNQAGSSVPEAQFIETGSGKFGSSGTGGVFGGFDDLSNKDAFTDTEKLINQYAQQELGSMIVART
jgi:hypothetical protein|tara:strand:+ start:2418 stop:3629 length:1212 start_codon:yes stop_codon:yes gene_type:complete